VDFGVSYFPTDESIEPAELARMAEERGFESVFVTEHTHIPASRETPYPGGELPRDYIRLTDLFVSLTAAALATTRIRVCSGVIQLAQRDPIICAKEAATLDWLSGGRLDLIVGTGWNLEEMRNHGVDPARKYDVVREHMLALKEIWTTDTASFDGEFVSFHEIWSWPKPVQPGGVPLVLGGNSPGSEERAIAYGDGWAPIHAPGIVDRIRAFRAGSALPVTAVAVPPEPGILEEYVAAGTDRAILWMPSVHAGEAERTLEEWSGVARAVAG
jgi:probable F420-dependent oxidoreductase